MLVMPAYPIEMQNPRKKAQWRPRAWTGPRDHLRPVIKARECPKETGVGRRSTEWPQRSNGPRSDS